MTTSSEREAGADASATPSDEAVRDPGAAGAAGAAGASGGSAPPEAARHASDAARESVGGPVTGPGVGLLALCGFGLLVTAGLLRDLGGRMVDGNLPDAMHYSWWLGWTVHALGHLDNPLVTDRHELAAGRQRDEQHDAAAARRRSSRR